MTDFRGKPLHQQSGKKKIVLEHKLCPGDVTVMSAAIESLHIQFPNEYQTDVDVTAPAIYEHNPRITKLDRNDAWLIRMAYPLINNCSVAPVHFMNGFVDYLGNELGILLRLQVNRPYIYLSDDEKKWLPQVHHLAGKAIKYWLVNAGVKTDFTAKGAGKKFYQDVVNRMRGRVQFVQIGEKGHNHPTLDGVIDMRGKTDTRQFIRLCYHADGGLGPSTFLQHVLAAFGKPYVCVAGAREPLSWLHYPTQVTLSTQGQISCGMKGCWKSRTVKVNDNDSKDNSLCEKPYWDGAEWVPSCLAMIHPCEVVDAIERLHFGGVVRLN